MNEFMIGGMRTLREYLPAACNQCLPVALQELAALQLPLLAWPLLHVRLLLT